MQRDERVQSEANQLWLETLLIHDRRNLPHETANGIHKSQKSALTRLAEHALAGAHLSKLMEEAVLTVATTLGVEYCRILENCPEKDLLHVRTQEGWTKDIDMDIPFSPESTPHIQFALSSKRMLIVEDFLVEKRFQTPGLLVASGIVGGVCAVIERRTRPFGCLEVYTTRLRRFKKEEIHFIQAVANILAHAIRRKRSEEVLQRSKQRLESLVQERTKELSKSNQDLQHPVTAHQETEAKLRSSLEEKEVLLKEIHHRVKNNLQIISSLLNLQAAYVKDEQDLEIFRESRNRIKSMSLIHEQLYQSDDLSSIPFERYIQNQAAYLMRSYGAPTHLIQMDVQVDSQLLLPIDTAIPCGLMINELVSNAIKHAFPDGRSGKIDVLFHRSPSENHYQLVVRDDGIGLPGDVDIKNTASLGLQLVSQLGEQMESQIEVLRDHGTTFKVTF